MRKLGRLMKRFIRDESGVGTVEIILILVVLIALVLIFKDQMTALVNSIFSKIKSESGKVELKENEEKKEICLRVNNHTTASRNELCAYYDHGVNGAVPDNHH